MIFKLLDQVFVLFIKTLSYIAIGLVVSLWFLVALAIVVNIYKLFV
jgi:hypothetical protein